MNTRDAILFCNWLSSKLELPEAYHFGELGPDRPNWIKCPLSDSESVYVDPESLGVRIPTRDELFRSARFEDSQFSSMSYSPKILEDMAVFDYRKGSALIPRLLGESLPNPLGFSDVLGNLGELVLEPKTRKFLLWAPCYLTAVPQRGSSFTSDQDMMDFGPVRSHASGVRISLHTKRNP